MRLLPTLRTNITRKTSPSISTKLAAVFLAAATTMQVAPSPALANTENGDQMRITVANELRTHTRKIAAAACHIAEGINLDGSQQKLADTTAEFDVFLDTLKNGNTDFGIPTAEERRKTLVAIEAVEALWATSRTNAQDVLDNGASEDVVAQIVQGNAALLTQVEILTAEITGQYANPAEMVIADSFLIEIATRQRTLIQEMEIKSCMMRLGIAATESAASLESAMQVFAASLDALQNGLASAGVRPPPTSEIADGLAQVSGDWAELRPRLESILSGEALSEEAELRKLQLLESMMDDMTEVVQMYVEELQA